MIFISTALYHEAKPLIQHFRLKKATLSSPPPGRMQLFTGSPSSLGQEVLLVVGGTGPLAAAVATTYALTAARVSERDFFLNIGICGTVRKDWPRGEAVLCHKIIHHDTGRAYFPDVLIRHPFREGVLETFSHPVTAAMETDGKSTGEATRNIAGKSTGTIAGETPPPAGHVPAGDVVDMEGAGCFEAAAAFLPPHRMLFVKVISDHLDAALPNRPDPANANRLDGPAISGLIAAQIPALEETLRRAQQLNDAIEAPLLTEEEAQLIHSLQEHLRLTAAMSHQLRRLALQYKAATGGAGSLEILRPFLQQPVQTKQEGKMALEQIRSLLLPD
ncbi:MAG: hypothetical protein BAA01_03170 [Bacillus thermozeamaize]|uniref:Nucleoside phosphorylase domain-containing protein n=1 Tax=Bacillus thermozeamaize TaxID=230954 RepID=A0A1Y3PR56_9BACI|nr:MAG: hypothetical protein BAA01_03170 [Bacillus thermozeamaize]